MADAPIPYRKIRGTGTGAFDYTSLYAGPDHLLHVTSTGYSESYRRFYFRDIKSLTVLKSGGGKVINGILGGIVLLCGIVGLQTGSGAWWAWSIPALFFLVLLVVNILRGPTCLCQIQTAVQTRKLGSLKRLRQARKFLDLLRPQIDAAQGALPPGEIIRRLEQIRQGGFFTISEAASAPVAPASSPSPAPASPSAPEAAGGFQ